LCEIRNERTRRTPILTVAENLGPERRRTLYSVLKLCVDALADERLAMRGAAGGEKLGGKP
jgi:hypothetical protein